MKACGWSRGPCLFLRGSFVLGLDTTIERIDFSFVVVASSGDGQVQASPVGPEQGSLGMEPFRPDDVDQQPPDFQLGQGNQLRRLFERRLGGGQETQGDAPVPTLPGSHLVFIESRLLLGALETGFDGPSPACDVGLTIGAPMPTPDQPTLGSIELSA